MFWVLFRNAVTLLRNSMILLQLFYALMGKTRAAILEQSFPHNQGNPLLNILPYILCSIWWPYVSLGHCSAFSFLVIFTLALLVCSHMCVDQYSEKDSRNGLQLSRAKLALWCILALSLSLSLFLCAASPSPLCIEFLLSSTLSCKFCLPWCPQILNSVSSTQGDFQAVLVAPLYTL